MFLEALQIPLMAANITLAADVVQCRMDAAPRVRVSARADSTKYNRSMDTNRLSAQATDTISPYASHQNTVTRGRMDGYIQVKTRTGFKGRTWPELGLGCIWYDKVNVTIHISPTINIASDVKKGSCEYREILKHEQKHVQVDREIVNKYANKIGEALRLSIDNAGARGPYPDARLQEIKQDMQTYIASVIKTQQSLMKEERYRRQQEIDSLEEYQRVQNACN